MSGAAIIRAMLASHAPVLATVPATRIVLGPLPQGTPLPGISVSTVDSYEVGTIARGERVSTIKERVQVTILTKSYRTQKELILAAKMGNGTHYGEVAGFKVLAVVPQGVGPDLNNLEDDGIYEQSRDFMVTFTEAN